MTFEKSTDTINKEKLNLLPTYNKPPSYQIQTDPGNGCFLDPPGYPTYFTQSVYTKQGGTPPRGVTLILMGRVVESHSDWKPDMDWDKLSKIRASKLRKLWNPLPLDHPRTVAWIRAVYKHLQNCYHNKGSDESDKTLIYPIPSYKLKSFVDDERFSDEWRIKERAAIDQANSETITNALKVATPENHKAVRLIQRFYPEHQPDTELIKNPPSSTPTWWERFSECPTHETCPGGMGRKHPLNGSWCQVCGWHE